MNTSEVKNILIKSLKKYGGYYSSKMVAALKRLELERKLLGKEIQTERFEKLFPNKETKGEK